MYRNESENSFRMLVDRRKIEHEARDLIRKQSLDPYNRLHSIAEDIEFVQSIHQNYSAYPLLANVRCGAWYCDSRMAGFVTVHFKSADGHYNGWSFNLRRPNLHILPLIHDAGGVCIVDSTRSGKRMPDSLSKTVPIWCTVVNRALAIRGLTRLHSWDTKLHTSPQCVSKQEHDQVEIKTDDWAISLANSSYDLPALDKPLRPIWVTPASSTFPSFGHDTPFVPIICISASKFVEGTERRRNGYSYVQGAGDDHENWSQGLQPDVFWEHKDELLKASQADFPCILARIVGGAHSISRTSEGWVRLATPVAHVNGLLSVAKLEHVPDSFSILWSAMEWPMSYITIRRCPNAPQLAPVNRTSPVNFVHDVAIPNDKKAGERAFKASLPGCLSFIRQHIQDHRQVCIACESGKDLSVGVAVVALQAFFDDTGMPDLDRDDHSQPQATKESIRSRLHWVISSRPEANPSRATLKRVNEFFMSSRHPSA